MARNRPPRSSGSGGSRRRRRGSDSGSGSGSDSGGDSGSSSKGGSSGSGKAPATKSRRRADPTSRPQQARQRQTSQKAGTVTKSVQERRGGFRQFVQEVIAELRKVTWPTRPVLLQSTAVVLFVVAIVTAYLALLDEIFGRLIDTLF